MTMRVFRYLISISRDLTILVLRFLLSFSFDWDLKQCLTTFPNASKISKNYPLRVVFSIRFSLFENVVLQDVWIRLIGRPITRTLALGFDIWHRSHGQLTPVETRYSLTSITWSYCGLWLRIHRGNFFHCCSGIGFLLYRTLKLG